MDYSSDLISARGFSAGFNTVDGKIKMAEVIKFNTKSSRVFNNIDANFRISRRFDQRNFSDEISSFGQNGRPLPRERVNITTFSR